MKGTPQMGVFQQPAAGIGIRMRNTDQSSSLFWLVLAIGIVLLSLTYGVGNFHEPGPGFITFFAGAILIVLSLALFFSNFGGRAEQSSLRSLWTGLETGKILYVLLLLVAYTFLLKPVGFLISTFLLLVLMFRVKGSYRLKTVFLMALLVTAGSYLVFEIWLKAQLPKGILEGII
ncbi:MAG: tripartite tricarboxylate transporter TctB family protein [Thermodesulfobacteriota bacterium]